MSNIERSEKDTTFDRLQKFYHSGTALSEKDVEFCNNLESAYAILSQEKIRSVAVRKFMAIHNVPLSTAYRYFKQAEELFAPMEKYHREFVRNMIIETALREIKQCDRLLKQTLTVDESTDKKILKSDDVKKWKAIQDVKHKAQVRLAKAAGIHDVEIEQFDWTKLEPHTYTIGVAPEIQEAFSKLTDGTIDITKIFNEMSVDIDFDELNDDDDDDE